LIIYETRLSARQTATFKAFVLSKVRKTQQDRVMGLLYVLQGHPLGLHLILIQIVIQEIQIVVIKNGQTHAGPGT